MLSKKVILTGSFGVGKTSLFNRFLYSRFDEKYLSTINAKVDKKVVEIDGESLKLMVWDIAGEASQNQVPKSYFLGAAGVIYVFDLSRPVTLVNFQEDLNYLRNLLPNGEIIVVGNKKDLVSQMEVDQLVARMGCSYDLLTSAKTEENVEEVFLRLGKGLLQRSK